MQNDLEKIIKKEVGKIVKESEERLDQKFEKWSKVSDERMERYVGALKEDFDHKMDVVLEILPEIQRKVDLTFDKVGELTVAQELNKEFIKDHEMRIQKLEATKSTF